MPESFADFFLQTAKLMSDELQRDCYTDALMRKAFRELDAEVRSNRSSTSAPQPLTGDTDGKA